MISLRFTPWPIAIVVGGFASSNVIGTDRVAASTTRPTETSRVALIGVSEPGISISATCCSGPARDAVRARRRRRRPFDRDDAVQELARFDRRSWRHGGFGDNAGNRGTHDHPLAGITGALAGPTQLQMLRVVPLRFSAASAALSCAARASSSRRCGTAPAAREAFDTAPDPVARAAEKASACDTSNRSTGALAEPVVAGDEFHERVPRVSSTPGGRPLPVAIRPAVGARTSTLPPTRGSTVAGTDDLATRQRIDPNGREVERPLLFLQERRRALFVGRDSATAEA